MSTTAGAITVGAVTPTTAQLSSAAATGGTAPYTYQWYRSTTSGFTPGAGNLISGATGLALSDSGLIPGTKYYYELVATDAGAVAGNSAQSVDTTVAAYPGILNQFGMGPCLGMPDLRVNFNTVAAEIDSSTPGPAVAGQFMKVVNSTGGVPKIIPCVANSDVPYGAIAFDAKSQNFPALAKCELSQKGNVQYQYATGAIARGAWLTLDVTTVGGVQAAIASGGLPIVGFAVDAATAAGQLIRVEIELPNRQVS